MAEQAPASPQSSLSVIDGMAMLVGIVIGIGIFKTPSLVAANVGSEAAFMGLWLLGGFVAMVGALCYAELGSSYPSAGGEYHFLSRAYGPRVGLFFAWARGTVIQTGAIAAVAFVFGDYANQIIPLGAHGPSIYAVVSVAAVTAINLAGTLQGKSTQVLFTALTVIAVVVVVGAAMLAPETAKIVPAAKETSLGAAGFAMVFVLLTYGGWNEAAYLSGELRDVRRNMVRTLALGVSVIVVSYLAINWAYLHVLGLQGIRDSNAVGADLMRHAVGAWGATLLSLIVCVTALSTLNGTVFTGARTYYALGQDLPLLGRLGAWQSRGQNPANAFVVQGAISIALIVFGAMTREGFETMVAYTAPVFWFFMLLVAVAVYVFRWREPNRERPFKIPFYPFTPVVFALACVWMLYSSLAYAGIGSILGVVVLLLGTPLLFASRRAAAE